MSFAERINSGEVSADEVINLLVTSAKNRKYMEDFEHANIETVELGSNVIFILNEPYIEENSMKLSKTVIKSIDIPQTIGKRISQIRKELGLTQEELADSIGVEKSTVAHYESNRRLPRVDIMVRISDVLECSLDYLMKGKWDISLVGKVL